MDSTSIILLSSLTVLAVIDFLNLKKSKLPIKTCLTNAAIAFVLSYIATALLSVILSMIFGNFALGIDVLLIIALVLVLIFNYFRIKDRIIKNKKITSKEEGVFERLILGIVILIGFSFFAWLTFLYITFSIAIWNVTPAIINQSYGSFPLTVVTFLNNIMFYIFGSFAYKVSSIILFSIGATAFWTIISIGPALVKLLFEKK